VPDSEWIHAGLKRVIGDHRSGCAFIQDRILCDLLQLYKNHCFESFKSTRRHDHPTSISQQFVYHHAQLALKENDPINAGVISDEMVSNSSGTMIRRVRYRIPETGEVMEFLTNLGNSIAPESSRNSTSCAGGFKKVSTS